MDTDTSTNPPPNHHGDHAGFSGISGWLAGRSIAVGRDGDAELAIRLTGLGPQDHVVDVGCGPGVALESLSLSSRRRRRTPSTSLTRCSRWPCSACSSSSLIGRSCDE